MYLSTYDIFNDFPFVQYGISDRSCGTMNAKPTGMGTFDAAAFHNRAEYLARRGMSKFDFVVAPRLVHGNNIIVADAQHKNGFPEADGCITRMFNVCLTITAGDCPPVFFYHDHEDLARCMIGLAHSGRGGISKGVISCMLRKMIDMGCSPGSIRVAIGPGIGQCCYRLDSEHADQLMKYPKYITRISDNVNFVDLPGMIGEQAMESGVEYKHIQTSGACTCCLSDIFFSHWRDKVFPTRVMLAYMYLGFTL